MPNEVPHTWEGVIKAIALHAFEAGKPVVIHFGKVESVSPLTIRIDANTLLAEDELILSHMVRDHAVDITVSHQTEDAELRESLATDFKKHRHNYIGQKRITMHYGLAIGEQVVLLRQQGGQLFYVIDRTGDIGVKGEWL